MLAEFLQQNLLGGGGGQNQDLIVQANAPRQMLRGLGNNWEIERRMFGELGPTLGKRCPLAFFALF